MSSIAIYSMLNHIYTYNRQNILFKLPAEQALPNIGSLAKADLVLPLDNKNN